MEYHFINNAVYYWYELNNYFPQKSTKSSSRAIYIQSLANVGNLEGLKVLAHVAKDSKYSSDKNLQLLAINGLTKNHLKNSSYEFVSIMI